MKSWQKIICLFASAFVTLVTLPVFAVEPEDEPRAAAGDYDGDSLSDAVVARKLLGGWYWFIRYATGSEETPIAFGLGGAGGTTDTLLAGDFDGDAEFEPGVVRSVGNYLYWYNLISNQAVETQWGLSGDTPVTGYFDVDGTMDRAVVRNIDGFLYWFIRTATQEQIINLQWGLNGDIPFAGNFNSGARVDELVVARTMLGGIYWFVRTIDGEAIPTIQWGLAGDTLLPPTDFNADGRDDLIVVREEGNGMVAYVRYSGGNGTALGTETINFGLTGDLPYVGTLTQAGEGEFGVYRTNSGTTSTFFYRRPNAQEVSFDFGLEGDTLVRPDGQAASTGEDEEEEEEENGGGGGAGLLSVCSTVSPLSGGFLWKPSSDHSGPPREGKPAAIIESNKPSDSCLSVYAEDGTEVSRLGVYEYSGKYGGRWYTGWGCGDLKSGSQIASAAQSATGNPKVYIERTSGDCEGPFDPRNRHDLR